MNNYEFCVQWVLDNKTEHPVRVLDYGCGAGKIVNALRNKGIEAFGCDVFYQGGDYSKYIDPALFENVIKRMDGYVIPFDDASFDFVINNQVMEHVENLDSVLAEIQRVLKHGGSVLSLFPDNSVLREGHCGIAFLHWFPKGSKLRVYYAAACRALGLGYHKGNKTIMDWSREFCEWLDKWTYYRPREEICSTYNKYFVNVQYIEDYWLHQRLEKRKILVNWLPVAIQTLVVRKLAGMVFTAYKQ